MSLAFDPVITWFLPTALGLAGYALLFVGFFLLTQAALKFLGPMDIILRMNIGRRIRLATWIMGGGLSLLVIREVVLFLVFALVTGGMVAGPGAYWSYEDRSGQVAVSESSEGETVVATAAEESISLGELREAVMHLQQMKLMAEGDLQRRLDEEIGQPSDHLEDLRNVGLKWGDDNVALAELIKDRLLYQEAVRLGYEVTDEELEENIEWARDAYERGLWGDYNEGWIESLGADHYFENLYPVLATRSMAIGKLYKGMGEEVGTNYYDGEPPLRYTFEEGVIAAADITVLESEDHSATLDGVLGFLADVRETDIAHWRKEKGY